MYFYISETLFLATIAGVGLLAGFSNGVSLAKKKDETHFNKASFRFFEFFFVEKLKLFLFFKNYFFLIVGFDDAQ